MIEMRWHQKTLVTIDDRARTSTNSTTVLQYRVCDPNTGPNFWHWIDVPTVVAPKSYIVAKGMEHLVPSDACEPEKIQD